MTVFSSPTKSPPLHLPQLCLVYVHPVRPIVCIVGKRTGWHGVLNTLGGVRIVISSRLKFRGARNTVVSTQARGTRNMEHTWQEVQQRANSGP